MVRTFNSAAMPKCLMKLSKAKQSLQRCRSAAGFQEFASHWSDFLTHTGGVLNALEAGANGTPQGRQWWNADVKKKARADPLLRYMHQARNVEEHELNPTSRLQPRAVGIGLGGENIMIDRAEITREFFENPQVAAARQAWRTSDGRIPTVVYIPEGPRLATLADVRYKTVFEPPQEYNGKRLRDNSPIVVAELYIAYLEDLIATAGEFS
ncbi:MAG: hypothetical protein EOS08_30350 [Mesorhizobium sp.]|nr:MAG: hypothetical protein EOS08_30350 [Mesorhizobium sp.]